MDSLCHQKVILIKKHFKTQQKRDAVADYNDYKINVLNTFHYFSRRLEGKERHALIVIPLLQRYGVETMRDSLYVMHADSTTNFIM